ncbi:PhzF family phenazine biosynthesis protein [Paenibacillus protaetiae]|nr:PhzF family phenazine biosynthesis protein [Paenibacillus protaetiae]
MVDSFTSEPFRGNPAAVCLLDKAEDGQWMQQVAAEMNVSETAFVYPEAGLWRLRWFTPVVEERLCGHATLAAAHILWQSGRLQPGETARFMTLSGQLTAQQNGAGGITLDFPSEPVQPVETEQALIEALGLIPRYTGRNRLDLLVEVDSEQTVRQLRPDMALLAKLDCRGVIVTSRAAGSGYDFVSRFFAPMDGISEDPVTGSAHCALAPYWGKRLRRDSLVGYQASARGGYVAVQLAGDRVRLTGEAVTVMKGSLEV